MTEYTVTASGDSGQVTATATDDNASIAITYEEEVVENGSTITFADGESDLVITVSEFGGTKTYTVTITKETAEVGEEVGG